MRTTYLIALISTMIGGGIYVTQPPTWRPSNKYAPWDRLDLNRTAVVGLEDATLDIQTLPIPTPLPGQVLIEVRAAPVNPSDVYNVLGRNSYVGQVTYPIMGGLEGSGVVVASGGGSLGYLYTKMNARVAFIQPVGGSWSTYVVANADQVLPLPSDVSFEMGASCFVNPVTVVAMLEYASMYGHTSIINSAAASQLGLMLIRMAPLYDIKVVNIVRGGHNVQLLKDAGVDDSLIVQSDEGAFVESLAAAVKQHQVTLVFDAVGGSFAKTLFEALPSTGEFVGYGVLSGERASIDSPGTRKFTRSWIGPTWMLESGIIVTAKTMLTVRSYLSTILSTTYEKRIPLTSSEVVLEALNKYSKHQKGGKTVLVMDP